MRRVVAAITIIASLGCGAMQIGDLAADPARVSDAAGATQPVPPTNGDWPGYRGPHRNGISTEKGWQSQWPAEGPKRLWSAQVGLGYSAVSVADGKAFAMGNRDGQETVYCFDAVTGRELWKFSYPCGLVDNLHLGGPGSTPTVDGDRVYTLSKEGHLHALRVADGGVLWKLELQKQFETTLPEWGFTSSALIVGEKLILDAGGLVALNKQSGALVWRGNKYRAGYGSPVLFDLPDGAARVAHVTNDCLIVVGTDDGGELARYDWSSEYATTATTPVVSGRTLFLSTGYGGGCALIEFREGQLVELYRNRELSTHMSTPILWQGHLYGIDGNSHNSRLCKLVCLNLATGKKVWEQRGFGCGALMAADGKLLIMGDEGRLSVAEATPDAYREKAQTKVFDDHTWTMPVLAHGRIYCRGEAGEVVCLDVGS